MSSSSETSDYYSVTERRSLRGIDPKWLFLGGSMLITVWLALVPLGFLLWQSFTASDAAGLTLRNFLEAYTRPDSIALFSNTIQFAAGTAFFSLLVGTFFAWVNERTNTPLKPLFFALSVVPLIIPGILFAAAWMMLASPKIGMLNLAARNWFGVSEPIFNIYSMTGMVWVDGLHYSPIAFLLVTAALRSMDPSLEEAAMMSGASIRQVAFRITLKLIWPAILAAFLILFVRAAESFEVPALIGIPVGIEVYTSSIYDALHRYPSDVGLASAYAVILLVITCVGILLQSWLTRGAGRYSTVTGKAFRPRVMDIGHWRWATAGIFILYALLVVVLPFLVLLWSSLQKYYAPPSWNGLKHLTLVSYQNVLAFPGFGSAVENSLLLAVGSATLVMLLTSVISWIVIRTRLPGRMILDNIATLPLVFPGLVLGLSLMVFYLAVPFGIYGTLWILLIAYMTKFLPYGMRYCSTSMMQLHKELEESAAMSGASWGKIFLRIVLPLLKPGLLAGWIYIIVVSVRELSSSVLLYSPGSEVVSIVIWEFWQNGQYVELSAFGVMLIVVLFCFVMLAQLLGKRFGVAQV